MQKLLLVTGAGRSGTSVAAGTLKRLGAHVPQPEKAADEANPRGYYESSWLVTFHSRWLKGLRVRAIDTRPDAGAIVMADLTPEREQRLRDWLGARAAEVPGDAILLAKEVRAFWAYDLWSRVVAAHGMELLSLTMVRHPTQVIRSLATAYQAERSPEARQRLETTNVAAWVNALLETERVTRANSRAFVRYPDLVADWRSAVGRAATQLDLDLGDLRAHTDIDGFVSADLDRSESSWDGLSVSAPLRDLADRTWAAAERLVHSPSDPDVAAVFDDLRAEYAETHTTALGIAADVADAAVRDVRLRLRARLAEKDAEIAALRAQLTAR